MKIFTNMQSLVNFSKIILPLLLVTIGGCSSLRHDVDSIGTWSASKLINKDSKSTIINIINTESIDRTGKSEQEINTDFELSLKNISSDKYINVRNETLTELYRISNNLCQQYKTDLLQKQARGNFLLGTTALLLGTAGAVSSGATAARALAGGAAFATGVRSEINQEYYFNQTVQVLSKAIDTKREIIWGVIATKRDKSQNEYTIRESLVDIDKYHDTCSLTGALAALEKAVDSIDISASIKASTEAASDAVKLRTTIQTIKN